METLSTTSSEAGSSERRPLDGLPAAALTAGAGTAGQKTWNLARPVTLLGSSRHVHIHLDDLGVEPVHAALLNTGQAIVLADLVSRQGTFLDAQRVRARVLQPGQSFRLGSFLLRLDAAAVPVLSPADPEDLLRLPELVTLCVSRGQAGQWTASAVGTIVGSRPGCDIRLPSKDVLPLHAIVTRVGSQVVLASLAADRSIRINGAATNLSVLQTGDVLTIWPICLQVSMTPSRPDRAPMPAMPGTQAKEQAEMSTRQPQAAVQPCDRSEPPAPLPAGLAMPAAPDGEIPQIGSRLIELEEQLRNSSKQLRQWQQQLEQYANGLIRRDAELTRRSEQLDQLQSRLQQVEGALQTREQKLAEQEGRLLLETRQVQQTQQDLQAQRRQVEQQWAAITTGKEQIDAERRTLAAERETQQAERTRLFEQFSQALSEAWNRVRDGADRAPREPALRTGQKAMPR